MKLFIPGLLIGAVICFLLMRGCAGKVTPIDTHVVDSLNGAIKNRDSVYSKDSLQWTRQSHIKDSFIVSLSNSKELQLEAFKGQIVQLTFQRNKYRTASEGKDTAAKLQACDDFIQLADSFYTKAVYYEVTIDSLLKVHTGKESDDSATIKALMADRLVGQQQIAALQKLLSDALKQNADLAAALKRSKRGRWLIAGIAALLGGLVVGAVK